MRFPKTFKREKRQLSLLGDHAQAKPNLSLTLGANQTGNIVELNSVGKTGGNLLNIDRLGNITGTFSNTYTTGNINILNGSGLHIAGTTGVYVSGGNWNFLVPVSANFGITLSGANISGGGTISATYFSGDGSNLTSLNANSLSSGTVATARLGSGTASSSTYLRGDQTWAFLPAAVTPGGSTTQLQYNNAGAFGGTSGLTWDSTNDVLTLTSATLTGTTSFPLLNLAQTWNNASGTFTALKLNITNTNSASGSKLIDLQVGGSSKFQVDKAGNITTYSLTTDAVGGVTIGGAKLLSDGGEDLLTSGGNLLDDGSGNMGVAGSLNVNSGYITTLGVNYLNDYSDYASITFNDSYQLQTNGGVILDDGSANMTANNMTSVGFFLNSSSVADTLCGFIPDSYGLPIADFGINAFQFGSVNSSYDGAIFRLDMRSDTEFFSVRYQNSSTEYVPLQITSLSSSSGTLSTLIGSGWGADNNNGTSSGEDLQVYNNAYVGGTLNAIGGFSINKSLVKSFAAIQIYNQQNFGGF